MKQSSTDGGLIIGKSNVALKGLNLRAWTCFSSKGQGVFLGERDLFSVGDGVISWYFRVGFQGCHKVSKQLILPSLSKQSDE